jgi:H+-transporting ATPase
MAAANGDLERGDVKKEIQREAHPNADDETLGEYNNLVRYISTYREGNKAVAASEDDDKPVKRHWWSKKSKDSGAGFETPQDWLDTDMRQGLKSAEVERRRKKTGWNELTTEKENVFLKFLSYFQGPILYGSSPHPTNFFFPSQTQANSSSVMELALLLAAGLRDWVDFGVIAGILLLNAIVGWYQEKQAADVVASLKGDIAMKSTVVRDGREMEIKARELVPGDIVSYLPSAVPEDQA